MVDAVEEDLEGRDLLGGREDAVVGPVHEELPELVLAAGAGHHVRVGRFVGRVHQAVAGGVQRQHRQPSQLAVEGQVVIQVVDGSGVGRDARGAVEAGQVGLQVEARRAV